MQSAADLDKLMLEELDKHGAFQMRQDSSMQPKDYVDLRKAILKFALLKHQPEKDRFTQVGVAALKKGF